MVLFGYNGFFEGFDIFFSGTFLLEIGCYFFLVVFFHKLFQTVNVIIFLGAVCLLYRQLVSQLVGRTGRIVFFIIYNRIADLLHGRILCCLDLQTAAVQGVIGLGFCVTKFLFQVFDHLLDQGVREIRSGSGHRTCFLIDGLDPAINIIIDGGVIIVGCNVALFFHVGKNSGPLL